MLRGIRQDLGQTLPRLSARLGIDRNTLGAYEREERLADLEFLAKFSKITGCDLGKLVEARINASQFSPDLAAALKRIRDAAGAAARFAIRRSALTDSDISRLQTVAFEHDLDTEGLEQEYGPLYPAASVVEEPKAGYVYLPLYDVRASAGNGRIVGEEHIVDSLAFKEDWIRHELRARPGDLNLIYVEGDSMEPDLRAGDIVLLDHTDTRASREGVYVIRMDGALLVKQLQRLPGGVVKVISRNQAYEPFTVTVADVEEPNGFAVIGRVVWACRRF